MHCLAEQIKTVETRVQDPDAEYTALRAVADGRWDRADSGPDDSPGNGRHRTLSEWRDYASYCRCVDSTKVSNGKRKGQGNVKNGHPYLAWAYAEAAHFARRLQPCKCSAITNVSRRQTNVTSGPQDGGAQVGPGVLSHDASPGAFDAAKAFG